MSAAREEILGRVRAALGDHRQQTVAQAGYRRHGELDAGARVALFAERVADYRAEVHRVVDVTTVLAGLGTLALAPGLPENRRPPLYLVDDGLSPAELDRVDGVLTGCTVAIADTGTIVLSGGTHEGRRALSLIPDLHVCIVEARQIVQTVPEAFERLAPFATRSLTFISGPSATSDIELRRVEGVHGPRRLVVVIVDE